MCKVADCTEQRLYQHRGGRGDPEARAGALRVCNSLHPGHREGRDSDILQAPPARQNPQTQGQSTLKTLLQALNAHAAAFISGQPPASSLQPPASSLLGQQLAHSFPKGAGKKTWNSSLRLGDQDSFYCDQVPHGAAHGSFLRKPIRAQ